MRLVCMISNNASEGVVHMLLELLQSRMCDAYSANPVTQDWIYTHGPKLKSLLLGQSTSACEPPSKAMKSNFGQLNAMLHCAVFHIFVTQHNPKIFDVIVNWNPNGSMFCCLKGQPFFSITMAGKLIPQFAVCSTGHCNQGCAFG